MRLHVFFLLFFITTLCHQALADDEERRVAAIAKARPSVVSIRTYGSSGGEPGIGSGVIIQANGLILTNHHVLRNANVVKVRTIDEKDYTAQILHLAPTHDLALIKINGTGFRPIAIGSSQSVNLGQSAIAIGDPLGFSSTVTLGTVGGLKRSVKLNGVNYESLIQTDAAINPGSSGGALIDLNGKLIGINTLVYTGPQRWKKAQGIGFAIAIDHAMVVVKALLQRNPERVTSKPWLGIQGSTITRDLSESYGLKAKRGVLVRSVMPASPAEKAGLRAGDVLIKIDDVLLVGLPDLAELLSGRRAGEVVVFDRIREGKAGKVEVTLDVSSR